MEAPRANYLHYGDALECPELAFLDGRHGVVPKALVVEEITARGANGACLAGIVRAYGPPRSRLVNLDRLLGDLRASVALRARFQKLGCRGFSYRFSRVGSLMGPVSCDWLVLRRQVDLRFALMPEEALFYPPRVWEYVRHRRRGHCFRSGLPAIAFALGAQIRDAWHIFALQSDFAFSAPSYVRDHFRGWRKVLFADILRTAMDKVRVVRLCTAADALRACHPEYRVPQAVPQSWEPIYEGTAADFGMKPVELGRSVNIQVFSGQPAVYTRRFYEYVFANGGTECFEIR